MLSPRFDEALRYAARLHRGSRARSGTIGASSQPSARRAGAPRYAARRRAELHGLRDRAARTGDRERRMRRAEPDCKLAPRGASLHGSHEGGDVDASRELEFLVTAALIAFAACGGGEPGPVTPASTADPVAPRPHRRSTPRSRTARDRRRASADFGSATTMGSRRTRRLPGPSSSRPRLTRRGPSRRRPWRDAPRSPRR